MDVVFDDMHCSTLQKNGLVDSEVQIRTVKRAGRLYASVGRAEDFTLRRRLNIYAQGKKRDNFKRKKSAFRL